MSQRLEHTGSAAATTIPAGLAAGVLTFDVADATGWPTGAVGPFVVTIDADEATEERVLCDSRTGTTITVNALGRGWEGTTEQPHAATASARHTFSATEADEANRVVVEVDAVSGDLVGTTGAQTLSGKTIDLTDNDVVATLAELSAAVTDDDVVGVAATQTLTGKTVDLSDNTVTGTKAEFETAVSDGTPLWAETNDADWTAWAGMELYFSGTIASTSKGGWYRRDRGLLTGQTWADQGDNGPTFGGSSSSIQVALPVTPHIDDTDGGRDAKALGTWVFMNELNTPIASGVINYDPVTGRGNCADDSGVATVGSSFRRVMHVNWNYRVAD
jgi:hypothetical protein